MKYADLHVHTHFSDSTFSPEEVVSCAKKRGVDAIAICDHDAIDGIAPCIALGAQAGVEIIPGVELSAEMADAEIHLLGYFIDWKRPHLQQKLKELQELRTKRVYTILEKFHSFDINLDPAEVFKLSGAGSVGRLHIAQALYNAGKVGSIREAFDRYLGFMKPCYVPNIKFTPHHAIEFVLSAGGVPVLAHPVTVGKDAYIPEFVSYGLRGIEVYHTDHAAAVQKRYEAIAAVHHLIMTGGSDCHGLNKGKVLLGAVRVPYTVVEELRNAAGRGAARER